jgi:nucleoside-diphosphate-sugar epimerase
VEKDSLIYVAGHRGLVGSAICRNLRQNGFERLLLRSRAELDLTDAVAVRASSKQERPAHVFLAAAKVGGILANDLYPADFIRENLIIQTNVIDASYRAGVDRLLFLGSSCIYPKLCPQPIKEEYLLTGPARAHQPPLCVGQDRRHRDVLVLQPAIRHPLPGGDAHQSLRSGRQLRSPELARAAGADPQGGGGEGPGAQANCRLGNGHAAPRAALQ